VKFATSDSFFNGNIRVKQDPSGYRFSLDAVLLAHHIKPRAGQRVLDLGTGCGIIALILAYRNPAIKVCGIEVQKELYELAVSNVQANGLQDRISIVCKDMKLLTADIISGLVDIVVCNPPYRKAATGRINPDPQRAVARHEIMTTLRDVILTAGRMLRIAGRFVTIHTAERMVELLVQMKSNRIEPKVIRTIHSTEHAEAKMVLVEGVKQGVAGATIQAPLVLYDKDGEYSREVRQMFEP